MINLESPNTLSLVIFNSIAISNPIVKAWYSATLLEQFSMKVNAYVSQPKSGSVIGQR